MQSFKTIGLLLLVLVALGSDSATAQSWNRGWDEPADWPAASRPESHHGRPFGYFNSQLRDQGIQPPILAAAAVTSTWASATSGSWNVDANWTNVPALGGFPNNGNGGVATYDAVINAVGSAYVITINTSITIENLLLSSANATINQTAGTFTANAGINLSSGVYQLNGGTIANTVITFGGGSLVLAQNFSDLLTGVTVNGDLSFAANFSETRIAGGTTFANAHLLGVNATIGFAPGQTLTGSVLFEGGSGGSRFLEMDGNAGTFTIGATGVVRTVSGFGGNGILGSANTYGGAMTLINNGLMSSQVAGRTITIQSASFTNNGTGASLGVEALNGGILTISPAASWSNAGTIRLDANPLSTINLGGTFNTAGGIGTWNNAGGTVRHRWHHQ